MIKMLLALAVCISCPLSWLIHIACMTSTNKEAPPGVVGKLVQTVEKLLFKFFH